MYKEYLVKLIATLEKTEFCRKLDKIDSYEDAMKELVDFITQFKKEKRQLFFVGNGGSSAIASHMAADFMKNGGMKTYSLFDSAVTTCMGNDYGYEYVFSKPLEFLLNEGDLLIAISSSGNTDNVVNAVKTAKKKGAKVITLSGFNNDNKIVKMGDYNIYVPISHFGIVESIHNLLLQQIVDVILARDGVWCL